MHSVTPHHLLCNKEPVSLSGHVYTYLTDRIQHNYVITAFSHTHSYRVCVRVYLDADGIGRGTHLSIVLVLMRGEYDTQLQSPFRQQVTVRLQGGLLHCTRQG